MFSGDVAILMPEVHLGTPTPRYMPMPAVYLFWANCSIHA